MILTKKRIKLYYVRVSFSHSTSPLKNDKNSKFFAYHIGEVFYQNLTFLRLGILGVNIMLADSEPKVFYPNKDSNDISFVERFDFKIFDKSDELAKKKMILDVILKVFFMIDDKYNNINKDDVQAAYTKLLAEPLPENPWINL